MGAGSRWRNFPPADPHPCCRAGWPTSPRGRATGKRCGAWARWLNGSNLLSCRTADRLEFYIRWPVAVASGHQIPGVHEALTLDVYLATLFEHIVVLEPLIHRLRHLNPALDIGGFHARCDVHRVAPHVVEELARTNHPRDHRAGSQPDAQRNLPALRVFEIGDRIGHVEGEAGERLEVIRPRFGYAADHHVRVAACLDLLQPVPVDEGVEIGV